VKLAGHGVITAAARPYAAGVLTGAKPVPFYLLAGLAANLRRWSNFSG
jgi:hypothetical protein